MKNLEAHDDIFQVIQKCFSRNFKLIFYLEKFLRELGSKGVQPASADPVGI